MCASASVEESSFQNIEIRIPLEGGETLSIYVDENYNAWILAPSKLVLTKNDLATCRVKLFRTLSTRLGLVDKFRNLWTQFYTSRGKIITSNALRARDKVIVRTQAPDGPLALHIVEADGDVIIKLREGVKDWSKGLLELQSLAVWYATSVWRRDLQTIREAVRFGARLHQLSRVAAGLTFLGSPLAWNANKIVAVLLLLAGLSSIILSRSLNQFTRGHQ